MSVISKCIENKDWKALSIITYNHIQERKAAEARQKENEITCYSINNSRRIKRYLRNHN